MRLCEMHEKQRFSVWDDCCLLMMVLCCCCGVSLLGSFVQVSNVFESGGAHACSEHLQMTCIEIERTNKTGAYACLPRAGALVTTRRMCVRMHTTQHAGPIFCSKHVNHLKTCLFWRRIIGNLVYAVHPVYFGSGSSEILSIQR